MRNSDTFTFWVAAIIILHFIIGFIWLIIKMSPKKSDEKEKLDQDNE